MTIDEFEDWVKYHNAVYNGFAKFIGESVEAQNHWFTALEPWAVADAKRAVADHGMKPNKDKAMGHSARLADILEILQSRREAANRERENASYYAHVCGLCRNRGLVDVVARPGHEFADQHGGKFDASRCLSVACKCSAGDKYRAREQNTRDGKRPVGFDTFDAKKHETWLVWRRRERPHQQDEEFARVARLGLRQSIDKCKEVFATFGEIPQEPRNA